MYSRYLKEITLYSSSSSCSQSCCANFQRRKLIHSRHQARVGETDKRSNDDETTTHFSSSMTSLPSHSSMESSNLATASGNDERNTTDHTGNHSRHFANLLRYVVGQIRNETTDPSRTVTPSSTTMETATTST
jgi:hypothetical protein